MNRSLAPSSYRKLVSDIIRIYDDVRRTLVEAHWKIGKRIVEIEQDGAVRAAYGKELLPKLAGDLTRERGAGFSLTNLKRFRKFYRLYPKGAPAHQLTWAHHQELLSVPDLKKRLVFEKRAAEHGLNRDELRELIRTTGKRRGVPSSRMIDVTPLTPKKGPVGLYQIRSAEDVGWLRKGGLLFDHGFRFYRELDPEQGRGLKAGDIVAVSGIAIKKAEGEKKPGFTYAARPLKIVDGDTFWAALDAGLGGIARQKLRLRGIDCPEIDTPGGKVAKRFVEAILRDAVSLTVRSSKNDKYDRYEADVFVTDKNGAEVFLNNLLLETDHAVRMED